MPLKRYFSRHDTIKLRAQYLAVFAWAEIATIDLAWVIAETEAACSVANDLRWQQKNKDAIASYHAGEITEGQLAEALGVDRLEVRRIVQENGCER